MYKNLSGLLRNFLILVLLLLSQSYYVNARDAAKVLRQYGYLQLNSAGTEFELKDKLKLNLIYHKKTLAAIQVYSTCSVNDQDSNCSKISKRLYKDLIHLFQLIKPVGGFQQRDPIGVVSISGTAKWTNLYSSAFAVVVENNRQPLQSTDAKIIRFTLFYWLPLKGTIESKHEEIVGNNQFEVTKYFITVNGIKVAIDQQEYAHLSEGQIVELERTFDNSFARIKPLK